MQPATVKQRADMIERLVDDMTETVEQWALRDVASLAQYVREAEGFDAMSDDELAELCEARFGEGEE